MSSTRPYNLNPWPQRTPDVAVPSPYPSLSSSHGRATKRRRHDLYPDSSLRSRQVIADQNVVEAAMARCQLLSGNDVISCYPTHDTVIPQHEWASFVWNSRRPDLTQTNRVDVYLFRADSQEQILHERNLINPFGRAGSYTAQVNDSWFGTDGENWRRGNVSYPFYWVISRSDRPLDGNQLPQSIFSAVQTTFADSVIASRSSASAAASSASVLASLSSVAAALSSSSLTATLSTVPSTTATPGSVQSASSDSGFPRWAIAVITVLGFLAIASLGILIFLILRRMRRRSLEESDSNRNSMGSASPMMANAAQQGSPLLGSSLLPPQAHSPIGTGSAGGGVGLVGGAAMSERDRNPPSVIHDGASTASAGDSGPFSGADAAIMADAFRKMLRKPDFAGGPVEEAEDNHDGVSDDEYGGGDGDSAHHRQEPSGAGLLSRELAEEGRDIRSVSSERGVRVETQTVGGNGGTTGFQRKEETQ